MLQGDTQKYNEAMTGPHQSSHKRPVNISYDLTDATPPLLRKAEERQHQRRMIPTLTTYFS